MLATGKRGPRIREKNFNRGLKCHQKEKEKLGRVQGKFCLGVRKEGNQEWTCQRFLRNARKVTKKAGVHNPKKGKDDAWHWLKYVGIQ